MEKVKMEDIHRCSATVFICCSIHSVFTAIMAMVLFVYHKCNKVRVGAEDYTILQKVFKEE